MTPNQQARERMESYGIGQSNGFEGGFERLEGRAETQARVALGCNRWRIIPDQISHMADGLLIARFPEDGKWYEV